MKNIKKTYSNIKNKNFKINEEETYIVRMLNEVLEIKQQRTYTSEEFWKKIQNDYFDTLNKDMLKKLEKTIIKINKIEKAFITYEDWQEEMRRKYNANYYAGADDPVRPR